MSDDQTAAHSGLLQLTRAQVRTLYDKWFALTNEQANNLGFKAWLDTVQPVFAAEGAVTVQWQGMWLCIEADGRSHA